jgi:hypothetical protein
LVVVVAAAAAAAATQQGTALEQNGNGARELLGTALVPIAGGIEGRGQNLRSLKPLPIPRAPHYQRLQSQRTLQQKRLQSQKAPSQKILHSSKAQRKKMLSRGRLLRLATLAPPPNRAQKKRPQQMKEAPRAVLPLR